MGTYWWQKSACWAHNCALYQATGATGVTQRRSEIPRSRPHESAFGNSEFATAVTHLPKMSTTVVCVVYLKYGGDCVIFALDIACLLVKAEFWRNKRLTGKVNYWMLSEMSNKIRCVELLNYSYALPTITRVAAVPTIAGPLRWQWTVFRSVVTATLICLETVSVRLTKKQGNFVEAGYHPFQLQFRQGCGKNRDWK